MVGFAPEQCFHLAATFERTAETEGFWGENYHHNVRLSHHVATLVSEAESMRRLVFASSYLVYDPALYLFDEPQDAPRALRESDPVRPRNLCGSAKLMHEKELDFLARVPETPLQLRLRPDLSRLRARVEGRGLALGAVAERRTRVPLTAFRVEGMFDYVWAGDVAEGSCGWPNGRP